MIEVDSVEKEIKLIFEDSNIMNVKSGTTVKEILKLTPTGQLSIYDEDSGKLIPLN